MSVRLLTLFAVLLMLGGCVTHPDAPNELGNAQASNHDLVLAKTRLMPDPHTGRTTVLGPQIVQRAQFSKVIFIAYTRFDDSEVYRAIQITGFFPKRVYLNDVWSAGRKLKSKVVDRERTNCGYGCTTLETIEIPMSAAEISAYADHGITLEIIGRRDKVVVTIPAEYMAAVLAFHGRHAGCSGA